jgi:23S rRNA pseudouridine2605 synthase
MKIITEGIHRAASICGFNFVPGWEGGSMRLSRFLAVAGAASRRKAEDIIRAGRVRVNQALVKDPAFNVEAEHDRVELDGRVLQLEEPVYILLYKPAGYLSTVTDTHGRPTVLDLLPAVRQRLYPVGRLDLDTEGLLLLSNDGDFTYLITHPRHEIEKVYQAEVKGEVTRRVVRQLRDGVMVDGRPTSPARVKVLKRSRGRTRLEIRIHEGRKRQVKKMCASVGHPVLSLKRTALGVLTLQGLKPGDYRHLTRQEVDQLRSLAVEDGGHEFD